jgi:hypothetical protein
MDISRVIDGDDACEVHRVEKKKGTVVAVPFGFSSETWRRI